MALNLIDQKLAGARAVGTNELCLRVVWQAK